MSEEDIYIGGTSIQIGEHGFINQPKEIIEYIKYLQKELQQKENIIKEVREYTSKTQMPEGYKKMILEILDKE